MIKLGFILAIVAISGFCGAAALEGVQGVKVKSTGKLVGYERSADKIKSEENSAEVTACYFSDAAILRFKNRNGIDVVYYPREGHAIRYWRNGKSGVVKHTDKSSLEMLAAYMAPHLMTWEAEKAANKTGDDVTVQQENGNVTVQLSNEGNDAGIRHVNAYSGSNGKLEKQEMKIYWAPEKASVLNDVQFSEFDKSFPKVARKIHAVQNYPQSGPAIVWHEVSVDVSSIEPVKDAKKNEVLASLTTGLTEIPSAE
jgi:hypothetical protein